MRDYARAVDVNHSVLSRDSKWQLAWSAAKAESEKPIDEMHVGIKDEGIIEAWNERICDNCHAEPVSQTLEVGGRRVQLCNGCALDHGDRTMDGTS